MYSWSGGGGVPVALATAGMGITPNPELLKSMLLVVTGVNALVDILGANKGELEMTLVVLVYVEVLVLGCMEMSELIAIPWVATMGSVIPSVVPRLAVGLVVAIGLAGLLLLTALELVEPAVLVVELTRLVMLLVAMELFKLVILFATELGKLAVLQWPGRVAEVA